MSIHFRLKNKQDIEHLGSAISKQLAIISGLEYLDILQTENNLYKIKL